MLSKGHMDTLQHQKSWVRTNVTDASTDVTCTLTNGGSYKGRAPSRICEFDAIRDASLSLSFGMRTAYAPIVVADIVTVPRKGIHGRRPQSRVWFRGASFCRDRGCQGRIVLS